MRAFVYTERPRSVNRKKGTKAYQQLVRDAYEAFHGSHAPEVEPQYGIAYYFHKKPIAIDADNLSKPVWDALRGLCYVDDKTIRHRRSGTIDLRSADFHAFDLSRLPRDVADALIKAIAANDDILYVEVGALDETMFAVGIERSAKP